jgi:hypothetical protein
MDVQRNTARNQVIPVTGRRNSGKVTCQSGW